jgi:hypothetical protein
MLLDEYADVILEAAWRRRCHEGGPPLVTRSVMVTNREGPRRPASHVHAGLDLTCRRLDACLLSDGGNIWTSSPSRRMSNR